jgi:hypothetical protein
MAEPPGAQPALGIDAVEWLATGENRVTVIVTGRWRRRAAWRGRPMLVIEAHGRHRRFRAIPDPPSLAGATPGTWRISFSIPAELAPNLGGQAWLQLGALVVPLPGVVEAAGRRGEAAVHRGEEPEPPAAERPERPGDEARSEPAEPRPEPEQQASLQPQLATMEKRVRELERELAAARGNPWRERLNAEMAVASGMPPATVRDLPAFEQPGAQLAHVQLQQERRVLANAHNARVAELEQELRDHVVRAERLYDVIEELRMVLDGIRRESQASETVVEPERFDDALTRLRAEIPPFSEAPVVSETTSHEPALSPPSAPVGAATRKSWLLRALRKLAKEDPVAAGRIVVGLVPAGRLAYAEPVAYDLLLADAGCIQVTARGTATQVRQTAVARDMEDVDFRLTGEHQTLARLLVAGRLRRRLGRRMARVQGDRKALAALTSLVRTPLGLAELYAAGLRLDPALTLRLVALMVERQPTSSHRFTIAHRGPEGSLYLKVAGAGRPIVADAPPLGPVATTIVCEPGALMGALAHIEEPNVVIRGLTEPLELVRDWLQHAQSE